MQMKTRKAGPQLEYQSGGSTGKSTYEVRYQNEEGKNIRCVRGLRVDTQDRTVEPLDEKVLDQKMQRAFRKAQNIFNELDQTSRPRLKIA